jgi:hypothetical protein
MQQQQQKVETRERERERERGDKKRDEPPGTKVGKNLFAQSRFGQFVI